MKFYINYCTGFYYHDGVPEVGKREEIEVVSRLDLEAGIDAVPEGTEWFLTDEDGEELSVEDAMSSLD